MKIKYEKEEKHNGQEYGLTYCETMECNVGSWVCCHLCSFFRGHDAEAQVVECGFKQTEPA